MEETVTRVKRVVGLTLELASRQRILSGRELAQSTVGRCRTHRVFHSIEVLSDGRCLPCQITVASRESEWCASENEEKTYSLFSSLSLVLLPSDRCFYGVDRAHCEYL